MILFLIIYISGFLSTWGIFKIIRKIDPLTEADGSSKELEWEAIMLSFKVSLASWLGFLLGIAFLINLYYVKLKDNDPPKWL